MEGTTAFVAVGSNLGDRIAHLRYAVAALRRAPILEVVAVSPVYESSAHTSAPGEEQPDFLNAVVEVRTALDPHALLAYCKRIERARGRNREKGRRWAPRTLDLDLLIFGRDVVRDEQLSVPHPKLGVRRFVLLPLADLAPGLHVPPPFDATVETLLHDCPDADHPVITEHTL